jgi:uroporphyrinogen decarboxylase
MTTTMTSRERFLAACRREPTDRPPGWVMRQAGRYLEEYRALRQQHTFLEMMHQPELAAEVTCQPLRRFDMDAAVIFSDILVPCAAMGQTLEFQEGKGPVLTPPVRTRADVEALKDFEPLKAAGFLWESIRLVRSEIGADKAIIGFCGAPWTVASYMIEGGSSRSFEHTKKMMYGDPETFARLLERLTENLVRHLGMQVEAGADALQIFDSWGGALDAATYERVLAPHVAQLVGHAKKECPVILYLNGGSHLLETLADTGPNVLGLDWRVAPEDAMRRVGGRVALQGNLDPCALYGPPEVVAAEVTRVLDAFSDQKGYIFNLGSGILPSVPVESMETLFRTLQAR